MDSKIVSRRSFMKSAAVLGVAAQAVPLFNVRAQGAGRKFKIALVGCGGRGNGALNQCREAAKLIGAETEVVAVADVFKDKAVKTGKLHGVPEAHCFDGFDGYRKILALPVDIMLLATAPAFRPVHLEAAIAAGKHVFMEKPVAVDPPGVRRVLAAGAAAKQKGLTIVAGTQRRHEAGYRQIARAIQDGVIGTIVGGRVSWLGDIPWIKHREAGEDDAHYLARNWLNFSCMSGDHICEQHVHNLDVANWMLGRPPKTAAGMGGRARRETGDQFDFFGVDFDYGNDVHIHSMCRQIPGCYGGVFENFVGTKGSTMGGSAMKLYDGTKVSLPEIKLVSDHGQVQEHVDLLNSILKNEALNEAQNVAYATLTAVMGRITAYTGEIVRWLDLMENKDSPFYNMACTPAADDFEKGPVVAPPDDVVAAPGSGEKKKAAKKPAGKKGK